MEKLQLYALMPFML